MFILKEVSGKLMPKRHSKMIILLMLWKEKEEVKTSGLRSEDKPSPAGSSYL